MKGFLLSITTTLLMLTFASCKSEHDYRHEIASLDSLNNAIAAINEDLDHFEIFSPDSINQKLKYVQENFVGEMKENMALTIDEFANIEKNIDAQTTLRDSLLSRGNSLQSKCTKLKQAIAEKATHDALNNEITHDYILNAVAKEKENVIDWTGKCKAWKNNVVLVNNSFEKLMPVITQWTDSIPEKKSK